MEIEVGNRINFQVIPNRDFAHTSFTSIYGSEYYLKKLVSSNHLLSAALFGVGRRMHTVIVDKDEKRTFKLRAVHRDVVWGYPTTFDRVSIECSLIAFGIPYMSQGIDYLEKPTKIQMPEPKTPKIEASNFRKIGKLMLEEQIGFKYPVPSNFLELDHEEILEFLDLRRSGMNVLRYGKQSRIDKF